MKNLNKTLLTAVLSLSLQAVCSEGKQTPSDNSAKSTYCPALTCWHKDPCPLMTTPVDVIIATKLRYSWATIVSDDCGLYNIYFKNGDFATIKGHGHLTYEDHSINLNTVEAKALLKNLGIEV